MNVFHHHKVGIIELAQIVHTDDIWMFEGCRDTGFIQEELFVSRDPTMLWEQSFNDDEAGKTSKAQTLGKEDLRHAADSELLQQRISSKTGFDLGQEANTLLV